MGKKVLLAGESWSSYTTHVKGFDAFYTSVYEEGAIRPDPARRGSAHPPSSAARHPIATTDNNWFFICSSRNRISGNSVAQGAGGFLFAS